MPVDKCNLSLSNICDRTGFNPNKGLKQGYYNGSYYYGEEFFKFLKLSQKEKANDLEELDLA